MVYVQNLKLQKLIIFSFAVLFIILQTAFIIKGTNYFLILPSIFLILIFKPKLLGYTSCFILGIINDVFTMQLLGMSSIVFVALKYVISTHVNRGYKSYIDLFIEYLIYGISIFVATIIIMLILGVVTLNFTLLLSILLQIIGFFICDFLWLKIFRLISVMPV